jgi:hypothetical protein
MHPFKMQEYLPPFPVHGKLKVPVIGSHRVIVLGYFRGLMGMGQANVPEQGIAIALHLPVGGYLDGAPPCTVSVGLKELLRGFSRILGPVKLPVSIKTQMKGGILPLPFKCSLSFWIGHQGGMCRLLVAFKYSGILVIGMQLCLAKRIAETCGNSHSIESFHGITI